MEKKLTVSFAPHIRGGDSVNIVMLDVIIALMPAIIAGVIIFGYRAALVVLVCIGSSVLFEYLWNKCLKKENTISDLSAVVTGLLLALNLPATIPFWIAVIGCLFAIIIVKQFFGGLGHNFINPAMAGRAFLLASWAMHMTKWINPGVKLDIFNNLDAVTTATPLSFLGATEAVTEATHVAAKLPSYLNLFIGNVGGCIGETSVLALLIGAGYLIARKVINLRIPLSYILTVAVMTFVFGGKGLFSGDWLYHIMSGGLILGAFFMATDYVTTPVTSKGHIVFGIGCGVLTSVIRLWGGYPEGVTYSILLMNVATPLIERYTAPRRFGKKAL